MNPKRKTTGIRVPQHSTCQALLKTLGNPIISTSAHLSREEEEDRDYVPLEPAQLFDEFESLVDILVDDGSVGGVKTSTILDLSAEEPVVVRQGLGWEELEKILVFEA